jgi:hypothetical protein
MKTHRLLKRTKRWSQACGEPHLTITYARDGMYGYVSEGIKRSTPTQDNVSGRDAVPKQLPHQRDLLSRLLRYSVQASIACCRPYSITAAISGSQCPCSKARDSRPMRHRRRRNISALWALLALAVPRGKVLRMRRSSKAADRSQKPS